jgi:hypothetical protein
LSGNGNECKPLVSGDEDDRDSSPVSGVSWARRENKWSAKKKAGGKTIWLGYHATEKAARQAVRNYVKDGTDGIKHFKPSSKFKGVYWDKSAGKWRAKVKSVNGGNKSVSLGEAVQVDPIKPQLKPPGTKRLKLNCDKLLSTFAFKFNLRRYTLDTTQRRKPLTRRAQPKSSGRLSS